ncbi:helix-turn-helix transcriptional regulator, partial [Synechococcus sp. R6-10]
MKSHDALLRNLMQAAGISTWRELRQKAKLSRGALNALRTGQAEKLKLADLNRAASILQVPLPNLIQDFSGIELASESVETAQELQRLHKQLEQQEGQLRHQIRAELVEKLKPLLVQYPTLQQVVQRRPDY